MSTSDLISVIHASELDALSVGGLVASGVASLVVVSLVIGLIKRF